MTRRPTAMGFSGEANPSGHCTVSCNVSPSLPFSSRRTLPDSFVDPSTCLPLSTLAPATGLSSLLMLSTTGKLVGFSVDAGASSNEQPVSSSVEPSRRPRRWVKDPVARRPCHTRAQERQGTPGAGAENGGPDKLRSDAQNTCIGGYILLVWAENGGISRPTGAVDQGRRSGFVSGDAVQCSP